MRFWILLALGLLLLALCGVAAWFALRYVTLD